MTKVEIRCIADTRCILGEGPVWDTESGVLWWVDIKAPAIYRCNPRKQSRDRWAAPERIGSLAVRRDGGLLLALKSGFALYDPDKGRLAHLGAPEADLPGNRMNDGKCDPLGRFWAATMDDAESAATGHLYRLDPDHRVTRFDSGFVVPNGLGWSGDGRTMYFTDSVGRTIWAYDFNMAAGRPGARRIFARVPDEDGYPDGLCVDDEDCIWSAHWAGGRVTRYRPDGAIDRVVSLPVPLATSCCFGGAELNVLYVTSASIGLDDAARAEAPLSGGVFAIKGLGVRGLPSSRFGG
jgi:sugar lactone lactonase YvrE